jgi:hypothetical protein
MPLESDVPSTLISQRLSSLTTTRDFCTCRQSAPPCTLLTTIMNAMQYAPQPLIVKGFHTQKGRVNTIFTEWNSWTYHTKSHG